MGYQTSIILVGKPGHVRDALAGLIGSLPIAEAGDISDVPHLTDSVHPITAAHLICACDCQQAVELARQNSPAVILFAGAPFDNLDTCQTIKEIHNAAPHTRCLVLTETPNPQTETTFPTADAVLPISAPFDLFKATIEGLLKLSR